MEETPERYIVRPLTFIYDTSDVLLYDLSIIQELLRLEGKEGVFSCQVINLILFLISADM